MKRIFLFVFAFVLTSSVYSQFDVTNLRAGLGLYYATEIKNIGLNFNGAYAITDQWEAAIGFTHVFEKDYVKWNMLDLEGHYVFYAPDEKIGIYGLAGLSFLFWKVDIPAVDLGFGVTAGGEASDSEVGFNLGVGMNYAVTDNINVAPEMKFTLMDNSYFRIGAMVQYMF